MKNLLFIVMSLAAAVLLAEDKPAAQAKTGASPKAGATAKKAPAKAKAKPKTNAFEAYPGGPWLPVNNKKDHLFGYEISDGDLKHQPVMVVECDPTIEVSSDDRETDPKYIYQFMGWEVKVQPHLEVINVSTKALSKNELAGFGKLAAKSAGVPGFPWYQNFGLEKKPSNAAGIYPFYYVVDAEGNVIYAGNKGKQAQSAVYGALKKCGEPNPMYGFVHPAIHTNIAVRLGVGTNCTAEVKKLALLAAKGSDESRAEAQAILDAIEQSKTYMYKTLAATARAEPQKALIEADLVMKTFPRDKAKFAEAVSKFKNNKAVQSTLQLFKKLYRIHLKLENAEAGAMKKKDANLAYLDAIKGERLVNKFHKEIGENGTIPAPVKAFEDLVQTVKAELEAQGAGPTTK